jgi:hypothetical protein
MLTGSSPLRLPDYSGMLPAVVLLTCSCRLRYVVLTGVADQGADLVRAQAEARGAVFIDAREVPFMNCGCGEALDFSTDEAEGRVM